MPGLEGEYQLDDWINCLSVNNDFNQSHCENTTNLRKHSLHILPQKMLIGPSHDVFGAMIEFLTVSSFVTLLFRL